MRGKDWGIEAFQRQIAREIYNEAKSEDFVQGLWLSALAFIRHDLGDS